MTTYTVFDPTSGRDLGRGLTAEQAMSELLGHDGYRYEIRKGEFRGQVCWELWHSDGSRNSTRSDRHMVKTVVFSFEPDEAKATQEIAEEVIKAGWPKLPACMADEDFDAMLAQTAAETAAWDDYNAGHIEEDELDERLAEAGGRRMTPEERAALEQRMAARRIEAREKQAEVEAKNAQVQQRWPDEWAATCGMTNRQRQQTLRRELRARLAQ